MTPGFWQHLMAAELPPAKSRAILSSLGTSPVEPVSHLLSSKVLTENERRLAKAADLRALESALGKGVRILTGENLPPALCEVPNQPPALFAWGNTEVFEKPSIAIVGTRSATTYGKAVAQKFAERLAASGVTIVSGGALGVDAAAHKGALAAGGSTVAVLATGVDRVYPRRNAELFFSIRESGCLVSQWACGSDAWNKFRFLARNHVIAALSRATLIVEAPEESGALTTARVSAEYGRPVFVVPANIDNVNFRGSHSLIRDGATLVDHPDQILEALGIEGVIEQPRDKSDLSGVQSRILEALSVDPILPEKIVASTGLPPAEVLSELTILEMEGHVIQDSGGYAIRP